jgi:N-acyl-D-aspartate/D-glutamate deacylase
LSVNSKTLKSPPNEAVADGKMQELLDSALDADARGDVAAAELKFGEAEEYATAVFGTRSWQLATVLFHASVFYSAHHRDCSARACFERMQQVMRW